MFFVLKLWIFRGSYKNQAEICLKYILYNFNIPDQHTSILEKVILYFKITTLFSSIPNYVLFISVISKPSHKNT